MPDDPTDAPGASSRPKWIALCGAPRAGKALRIPQSRRRVLPAREVLLVSRHPPSATHDHERVTGRSHRAAMDIQGGGGDDQETDQQHGNGCESFHAKHSFSSFVARSAAIL